MHWGDFAMHHSISQMGISNSTSFTNDVHWKMWSTLIFSIWSCGRWNREKAAVVEIEINRADSHWVGAGSQLFPFRCSVAQLCSQQNFVLINSMADIALYLSEGISVKTGQILSEKRNYASYPGSNVWLFWMLTYTRLNVLVLFCGFVCNVLFICFFCKKSLITVLNKSKYACSCIRTSAHMGGLWGVS